MTILTSKFNFNGHDPHRAALGSLTTVLAVHGATGPYSTPGGSGTPVIGPVFRGAIVCMDLAGSGEAVLADNDATVVAFQASGTRTMYFVAVDGDQDFDGAFVHKVTCIQGGVEILTDQFTADPGLVPGAPLRPGGTGAGDVGMFVLATPSIVPAADEQVYGYVGSEGVNATTGLLHVIIPQGV
jgi:hypothetical protein